MTHPIEQSHGHHARTAAPRRRRAAPSAGARTFSRALALAAVGFLASTLVAGPARADSDGWDRNAGRETLPSTAPHGLWLGNFRAADGVHAVCAADIGAYGPGSTATSDPVSRYGNPYALTSYQGSTLAGAPGPVVTSATLEQVAYVVSRWGATDDSDTAVAMDLAVLRLSGVEPSWLARNQDVGPSASSQADSMIAQAATGRGPYQVAPSASITPTGRAGEVTGIGVRGGTGSFLPGYPWTASITGPAVWDAVGESRLTGTTTGSAQTASLTSTGPGDIAVTVVVMDLPGTLQRMDPLNGSAASQRIFRAGSQQSVSGATGTLPLAAAFQPALLTQVRDRQVRAGQPLVDTVTISLPDGTWASDPTGAPLPVTVALTVYGPFDVPQSKQPDVSGQAPVVGVEELVFTGPGTQVTRGTVLAPSEGFYTWVASIRRVDQSAGTRPFLREDLTSAFFEESETAVVRHVPQVSSAVAATTRVVFAGDEVRDHVIVSGLAENHGTFGGPGGSIPPSGWEGDNATLTHYVYGPFATAPDTMSSPVDVASLTPAIGPVTTTDEDHDSVHDLAFAAPAEGGHYVIVSAFSGDARSEPATTSPYEAAEMFVVTPRPPADNTPAEAAAPPIEIPAAVPPAAPVVEAPAPATAAASALSVPSTAPAAATAMDELAQTGVDLTGPGVLGPGLLVVLLVAGGAALSLGAARRRTDGR